MLLSEICGLVSIGQPLWREDGSAISSVMTQWSESLRTGNQTKYGNLALQVGGVSDETVKYGYGFWATRTNEWLHCNLQIRPLVREGAPQIQERKFQTATFRQEVISGRKSHKGVRYQDLLTDWL
jgi:hypothetical protein